MPKSKKSALPRGKCVLLGDKGVGKTALLITFTTKKYPHQYLPTIFDDYACTVDVDAEEFQLELSDTNVGRLGGTLDRLRPLSYPNTDSFLLCFSVANRDSFDAVLQRWKGEVSHYCPGVPLMLVGTKSDLRNDPDTMEKVKAGEVSLVSRKEAEQLAVDINAVCYTECSAINQDNMDKVFHTAVRIMKDYHEVKSQYRAKHRKRCDIL